MLFNLVIAFIIPWVICIVHLFKKDKRIVHIIGSFSSIVAYTVQEIGEYFAFWIVAPFDKKVISTLPFVLGIYWVLGSYLIYFIKKYKHPYVFIILMTIITTMLEAAFVLFGRVIYGNGWTISWTFLSYLIPYIVVYWYYLYLKRVKILE